MHKIQIRFLHPIFTYINVITFDSGTTEIFLHSLEKGMAVCLDFSSFFFFLFIFFFFFFFFFYIFKLYLEKPTSECRI